MVIRTASRIPGGSKPYQRPQKARNLKSKEFIAWDVLVELDTRTDFKNC